MCTRVLALLALLVGLAHSFSWDIVVGEDKRLEFYYNGTLTHAENIPAANFITAVTYDPVHYRVLFADIHRNASTLQSFDISTRKIEHIVTNLTYYSSMSLAYDPVTQLLFYVEYYQRLYSLSLKPTSSNTANVGNLIVTSSFADIAVDSCGGFIYWITDNTIERAAFDGSKREVLIDGEVSHGRSLAIDQQAQKMYWIDEIYIDHYSIESADLNGKNKRTFYSIGTEFWASSLAVSKDFTYWRSYSQRAILQLLKSQQGPIVSNLINLKSNYSRQCIYCQRTAANYTIKDQTSGIKSCEALNSLILEVEEHDGSICHNYCLEGNCSVSAEGDPQCSCNRGYSGERCEIDACHKHCLNDGVCSLKEAAKPVCQCTADYKGERCDISICKDYCFQGNCTVSIEGRPTCRCNAGYSGERCEVNACHGHCLNNGDCFLNEEDAPVCQCTADYEGERCDVATTHTGACVCADKMTQQMLLDLRSEVKQVREDLQCNMQLNSDKLDENAAKLQICEKTNNNNQQIHDETTSKTQTSNMKY